MALYSTLHRASDTVYLKVKNKTYSLCYTRSFPTSSIDPVVSFRLWLLVGHLHCIVEGPFKNFYDLRKKLSSVYSIGGSLTYIPPTSTVGLVGCSERMYRKLICLYSKTIPSLDLEAHVQVGTYTKTVESGY